MPRGWRRVPIIFTMIKLKIDIDIIDNYRRILLNGENRFK
jgi:hypothetical protein